MAARKRPAPQEITVRGQIYITPATAGALIDRGAKFISDQRKALGWKTIRLGLTLYINKDDFDQFASRLKQEELSEDFVSTSDVCQILGLTQPAVGAIAHREGWPVAKKRGHEHLYRRWDLRWYQIIKAHPLGIAAPGGFVFPEHVAVLFDEPVHATQKRARDEGWPGRRLGHRLCYDRAAVERSHEAYQKTGVAAYESIDPNGPEYISVEAGCKMLGIDKTAFNYLVKKFQWKPEKFGGKKPYYLRWDVRWYQLKKEHPIEQRAPEGHLFLDEIARRQRIGLSALQKRIRQEGWQARRVGHRLSYAETDVLRAFGALDRQEDLLPPPDPKETISEAEACVQLGNIEAKELRKLAKKQGWAFADHGEQGRYYQRWDIRWYMLKKEHPLPDTPSEGYETPEQIAERFRIEVPQVLNRARSEKWPREKVGERWYFDRQAADRAFEVYRLEDTGQYISTEQVCQRIGGIAAYRVAQLSKEHAWRTLRGRERRILYSAEDVQAYTGSLRAPEGYLSLSDIVKRYQVDAERVRIQIQRRRWNFVAQNGRDYYAESEVDETYAYLKLVREGRYLSPQEAADLLELKETAIPALARKEHWGILRGEGRDRYYLTEDVFRYSEAPAGYYAVEEIMEKYGLQKGNLMRYANMAQWKREYRRRIVYYLRGDVDATLGGIKEVEEKEFVSLEDASAYLEITRTKFKGLAKRRGLNPVVGRSGVLYYRFADIAACRQEDPAFHLADYASFDQVAETWQAKRATVMRWGREENWRRVYRGHRVYVLLEDVHNSAHAPGAKPKKIGPPKGYVTLEKAAKQLEISPAGVSARAKNELWEKTRVGRHVYFEIESVKLSERRHKKKRKERADAGSKSRQSQSSSAGNDQ